MKFLLAMTVSIFATQAWAGGACEHVNNIDQATACVALHLDATEGEGELPNTVALSSEKKSKVALLQILRAVGADMDRELEVEIMTADYVAIGNVHYDEDLIFYYIINEGHVVAPKLIFDFNMADFGWGWDKGKMMKMKPLTWALYIEDAEDWHYDNFEEAYTYLEEQF